MRLIWQCAIAYKTGKRKPCIFMPGLLDQSPLHPSCCDSRAIKSQLLPLSPRLPHSLLPCHRLLPSLGRLAAWPQKVSVAFDDRRFLKQKHSPLGIYLLV